MNLKELGLKLFTLGGDFKKLIGVMLVDEFAASLANIERSLKKEIAEGKETGLQFPLGMLYVLVFNDPETKQTSYQVFNHHKSEKDDSVHQEALHPPISLLTVINKSLEHISLNEVFEYMPSSLGVGDEDRENFLKNPNIIFENFTTNVKQGLEDLSKKYKQDISFLVRRKRNKYGNIVPCLYLMSGAKTIKTIKPSELSNEFFPTKVATNQKKKLR